MRHRLHSICPYFAMFPEEFVRVNLQNLRPRGIIFDPFAGRGTTPFEAALNGYQSAGTDTNPVAVCISNAKLNSPALSDVLRRLDNLETQSKDFADGRRTSEFFRWCYNRSTLGQVRFLRHKLKWKKSALDCFIAALSLWSLHGESHRSPNYFSNRMPRTISTKPQYSVRWWQRFNCTPPKRDVFDILRRMAAFRLRDLAPIGRGRVAEKDARLAHVAFPELTGQISTIITSPPYLNVTDYHEDQWLRLWFLGGPESPSASNSDDRHTSPDLYWQFLQDAWAGTAPLLMPSARIVVRIGGKYLRIDSVGERLQASLSEGLQREVRPCGQGSISLFKRGQRKSFHSDSSRGMSREFDFTFCAHA